MDSFLQGRWGLGNHPFVCSTEGFATIWVAVAVALLPLLSLFLCAHLLESRIKRKERTISKEGQREKYLQWEAFRKQERRVLIPFQYKEALLVV
jgi:hypothetical protein